MDTSNIFDFGVSEELLNERCDLILEKTRIKENPNVYKTTSWATKDISIHHQVKRVQNLVVALKKKEVIKPGDIVYVVGAGFSGLFLASMLAQHFHAIVHILEENERPMEQFLDATNRFIAPSLNTYHETDHVRKFDVHSRWDDSIEADESNLIFQFEPGLAATVARRWIHDYKVATTNKPVFLHLQCTYQSYRVTANGKLMISYLDRKAYLDESKHGKKGQRNLSEYYKKQYRKHGGYQELVCDHIFLCTGFGKEKTFDGLSAAEISRVSYFKSGNEQDYSSIPEGGRVLLVGNGDSAVIELAHLLYKNFSHDSFYYALQFPTPDIGEATTIESVHLPFFNFTQVYGDETNRAEHNKDIRTFYDFAYAKYGSFQQFDKQAPPLVNAIRKYLDSASPLRKADFRFRGIDGNRDVFEFPIGYAMAVIENIFDANGCVLHQDLYFAEWKDIGAELQDLFWYSQLKLNEYILKEHVEKIELTRHYRVVKTLLEKQLYLEKRNVDIFFSGRSTTPDFSKLSDLNKVVLKYFLSLDNVSYIKTDIDPNLQLENDKYDKTLLRIGFDGVDETAISRRNIPDSMNYRMRFMSGKSFNSHDFKDIDDSNLKKGFNDILYDLDLHPDGKETVIFRDSWFPDGEPQEIRGRLSRCKPNPGYAPVSEFKSFNNRMKGMLRKYCLGYEPEEVKHVLKGDRGMTYYDWEYIFD